MKEQELEAKMAENKQREGGDQADQRDSQKEEELLEKEKKIKQR